MSFLQALDISGSGLTAERLRMDLVSNNIANINTTRSGRTTPAGNSIPYQREIPVFEARNQSPFASVLADQLDSTGNGVQVSAIVEDPAPFKLVYNPDHPDAIKQAEPGMPSGYVRMPNVDVVNEMVDMISASRAYEANVTVVNTTKAMAMKALEIGNK